MIKTLINTIFFRHRLTRIYTVFTYVIPAQAGIQFFPLFAVISVSSVANNLCGFRC
jgi:hypothetical protein